jgi:hypothetical protein
MTKVQSYIDKIIKQISVWDGVSAHSHRFGGTEFRYGKPEIGHIHMNGLTDIPFPRKIRDELVKEKIAQPHHILPESGWISFYVKNEKDIGNAVKLFRLSYLMYAIKRDENTNDYKEELEKLDLTQSVKKIYENMLTADRRNSHPDGP